MTRDDDRPPSNRIGPTATLTPPWNEVRVFLAVARSGGLAAAATTLGVSEATVSRRLRALEERTGRRLFDRLPNRLVPTALAERLAAAAATMADGADAFGRLLQAAGAATDVPVRVTATASVSLFVTRHLARLLDAAPGARLQIVTTRATLDLGHREAEVALRMRRPPAAGHLVVRRVGCIAFTAYVAAAPPTRPDPLPFIGLRNDPSSQQSTWLEALAGLAPMPVRLDDLHLRLEAVRGGAGASLLPCFLGDAEPGLRRLVPPPPALTEDIYLLTHRDLKDLPTVDAVRGGLVRLFRDEAAALSPSA